MKFGGKFNLFLFQSLVGAIDTIFEPFILFFVSLFNVYLVIGQIGIRLSTSKQYLQGDLMYAKCYRLDLFVDFPAISVVLLDGLKHFASGMEHVPSSLFILWLFLEESNAK